MLNTINNKIRDLFTKKVEYVNYETYRARVDWLSYFHFQQSVRRESIKNIGL